MINNELYINETKVRDDFERVCMAYEGDIDFVEDYIKRYNKLEDRTKELVWIRIEHYRDIELAFESLEKR